MKPLMTLAIIISALCASAQEKIENHESAHQKGEEAEGQVFHGRTVTRITNTELPDVVLRMVENGEFRKWNIEEAYRIQGGPDRLDGQSSFIIVVSRRKDRFVLYYDADGRLIRQEMMDIQETSSL